jgi:hypothetical protein
MRICGSQPRLAGLIAPKVVFLGLFCETLVARPVRTLRGHVRSHTIACEGVGRGQFCTLGERTAKTCCLLVTTASVWPLVAYHVVLGRAT